MTEVIAGIVTQNNNKVFLHSLHAYPFSSSKFDLVDRLAESRQSKFDIWILSFHITYNLSFNYILITGKCDFHIITYNHQSTGKFIKILTLKKP